MKFYTELHLQILEKETIECDDIVSLMGDYADKDLCSSLKARLDAHISQCEECQNFKDDYLGVIQLAKTINIAEPVPADVKNRLHTKLNERLGLNLSLT